MKKEINEIKKYKVCPKCKRELELNAENYYRDASSHNGFYPRCKKCFSEDKRQKRAEKREEKRLAEIEKYKDIKEYKICNNCGRKLQLSPVYFHRTKDTKDGFRCECKECKNKKDRERYYKNKEINNKKEEL